MTEENKKKEEQKTTDDFKAEKAIEEMSSMTPEQHEALITDFLINYNVSDLGDLINNVFGAFNKLTSSKEYQDLKKKK